MCVLINHAEYTWFSAEWGMSSMYISPKRYEISRIHDNLVTDSYEVLHYSESQLHEFSHRKAISVFFLCDGKICCSGSEFSDPCFDATSTGLLQGSVSVTRLLPSDQTWPLVSRLPSTRQQCRMWPVAHIVFWECPFVKGSTNTVKSFRLCQCRSFDSISRAAKIGII